MSVAAVTIEALARHPAALPQLEAWFKAEWPDWYGAGRGDARSDLQACARAGSAALPLGLLALRGGHPVGFAALKAASFEGLAHLTPWAAAGLVPAALRRQGIGRLLLAALEGEARALGFVTIYCGTGTSDSLLRREGWCRCQDFDHEGRVLSIYQKDL